MPDFKQILPCLGLGLALCATSAGALKPGQVCPIAVESLELNYRHQGGPSIPQLTAMLGNRAGKRILHARFQLSLLDGNGYPHAYPEDLIFDKGLDVDKRRNHVWPLVPESVDMHRTGESLMLLEVTFEDQTSWKDDGSESCGYGVDYHGK
jgi:hypothetical protein